MSLSKRTFALFGPVAAGKTVYLAAIYGSGGDPSRSGHGYRIGAPDDPQDGTHRYLAEQFKYLAQGDWPAGTAFGELRHLNFSFTSEKARYDVVLPDVSGEISRRELDPETKYGELKAKILREYQDYRGYLIFVPMDKPDSVRAVEYKWEVDALLNALQERAKSDGIIRRPVAVIVTKWDLRSPVPGDDSAEQTAAEAFVNAAYPALITGLRETCKNLEVFPVSSTGPLQNGRPRHPLSSYNLGRPLRWLLETADRVIWERAELYYQDHHRHLFRVDSDDDQKRSHYKVAWARFAEAANELPPGQLAVRAKERTEELRWLKLRRRMRLAVGAVAAGFLLLTLGIWWRDHVAFSDARARLQAPVTGQEPRATINRVTQLLDDRTHPIAGLLGWASDLQADVNRYEDNHEKELHALLRAQADRERTLADDEALLRGCSTFIEEFHHRQSERLAEVKLLKASLEKSTAELQAKRESMAIQALYDKYQQDPKPARLDELDSRCASFLKEFKSSSYARNVDKINSEVRLERVKADDDKAKAQLEGDIARNNADPLKCFELCTSFLKQLSSSRHAAAVEKLRDGFLQGADDRAWNEVKAFARNNGDLYRRILDKCDEYLGNALFQRHRPDAVAFRKNTVRTWDRSEYERIRRRAGEGTDHSVVLSVHELCQKYLGTQGHSRHMRAEVERWLKWYDAIQKGQEITVKLESVKVGKGSRFHGLLYYPNVYVTVRLDDRKHSSGEKVNLDIDKDEPDFPNSEMGPFVCKWDSSVRVTMTCTDFGDTVVEFTPPEGEKFQARHLNGVVKFDNGKIEARLRCEAVVPPQLPPYKD